MTENIEGQLGPLLCVFFSSKSTGKNFEIAILFNIVGKSNNCLRGGINHPQSPGGRATSYELDPLFVSSISYWEVYRRFLVGRGDASEDFSIEYFFMGEGNFP